MLSRRSHQLEWMDLGPSYYTNQEYRNCLYQLDRIGRFLGGDRATFWALKQLPFPPTSILDVGCGGGLFTLRLAAHYPQAQVVGIDISPDAIAFAQEHLKNNQPSLSNIQFLVSSPQIDEKSQFDVVMATLVCHHLSDQELISFLQQACRIAKQAVILNDLHRHPLATMGFAALVPIFFRNRMIWHDGLLSIRRSFTRQEWWNFLKAAGINEKDCSVTWHWAFRWMIRIDIAQRVCTRILEQVHESV
jgi:2-polyprenyl-3-methyl-5-hydroxy-6-metoxy-1,4-benzoquinol methylase